MKWIICIIAFIFPLSVFSEDCLPLDYCSDLVEHGEGVTAMNSLQQLFYEQQKSTIWDEDQFFMTFMLLCNVYYSQGMLGNLSDLCKDAMNIFNQKSPDNNTELSRTIWRMSGNIQMELKDYDNAIRYLQQAQWMYEDRSIYDSGYFTILTFLGDCYIKKKDFASAKLYLDEAEEIHTKYLGEITQSNIPDSYQLLIFKGLLFYFLGDNSKSEKYFNLVLDSYPEDLVLEGIKDIARNNLAVLYSIEGRYNEAMTMLNSIKSSTPEIKYINTQNIATNALTNNKFDIAIYYLSLSNDLAFDYLQSIVFDFSEVEKEEYWSEISNQLVKTNNYFALQTNCETALIMGFEINSFVRDFNLNFHRLIKRLYLSKDLPYRYKIWNQYQTNRGLLSYGFDSIEQHDSIALEVINTERQILSEVNFNVRDIYRKDYNIENIRRNLSANDVIIDFVYSSVKNCDNLSDGIEEVFSAYTLNTNKSFIQLTPVCTQRDLKSLVYNPYADADFVNQLYTEKSDSLYKLIIEPLLPALEGKTKLYIRPIGILSNININAILMPDGTRFGDKFDVRIVSDFNNINSENSINYSNIVLFGDPDFFSKQNNHCSSMSLSTQLSKEYDVITRSIRGIWGSLPGTKIEIEQISKIANLNHIANFSYIGKEASETMVKSFSGHSPSIMHFATHGYFVATKEEASHNYFLNNTTGYSGNNHLMLYSGLLFAGANKVWNGETSPNPIDDGILTADEISRLDFNNTNLIVLSACDTGKGHHIGIDSSMGLQRAFQEAGAKTMVTSLWKIPDDATALLMQYFYSYLFSDHSVRESLKLAQKALKEKGYTDPYYWASFYVLD